MPGINLEPPVGLIGAIPLLGGFAMVIVAANDRSFLLSYQRVLVAVDKGTAAAHAIDAGIELAAALKAEFAMVHVTNPPVMDDTPAGLPRSEMVELVRREGLSLFGAMRAKHALPRSTREILAGGDPATEIVRAAEDWRADIVVIGSHGRTAFSDALLGSVAQAVIRYATCPVLVVREPRRSLR